MDLAQKAAPSRSTLRYELLLFGRTGIGTTLNDKYSLES
jgi:hypothetical protein